MPTGDEVYGSAAQEAGRLFETLREWLDARAVAEAAIATNSAECRACPICLLLSALRENHPETVDHLGRAAEATMSAVRSLLVEHERHWAAGDGGDIQRIDIDE